MPKGLLDDRFGFPHHPRQFDIPARDLGNIGVLTMQAAKIAAHGGNRVGETARQNVKQRFFLDRIDMFGDEIAVDQGVECSSPVLPYPADPPFAIGDQTVMAA
jgi:hypothetical protein